MAVMRGSDVIGESGTDAHSTRDVAKVQDALYRIADMASGASDLPQFYRAMHEIVSELTYGENFIIALYDDEKKLLNFAYYADQVDKDIPDPDLWEPIGTGEARGATAFVLRTGQTQLINADRHEVLKAAGEVELVGELGEDWLGVPLKVDGKTIGALVVQTYDPGEHFTKDDIDLLEFVGQHVASALSRARAIAETKRLLAETKQRAAELTLINGVQAGLASRLDAQPIYDLVGDNLQQFFDAQVVDIGILDADVGVIRFPYTIERGVRFPDEPIPVMGMRKHVLETGQPLVVNERTAEVAASFGQPTILQGEAPKSSVFAPLIVGGQATGVISLQNLDRENAFSESDVDVLTTLVASLSMSLENVRLVDELRQRLAELGTVNSVGQAISAQLDPHELIQLVGERIRETFDADIAYVALLDTERQMIDFAYYYENGVTGPTDPLRYGEGWTSRVLMTRKPIIVNTVQERDTVDTHLIGTPARSFLAVPILVGEEAIGAISVQSTREEGRFSQGHERLLATIAAGVGAALQNSRLYAEMQTARDAAEAANDAKSTFLASVSHELRTPLTSVLGFAKVIRRQFEERIVPNVDASDPKTQRAISQVSDNVGVIVAEAERLTSLVNNVLDLAKIEAGAVDWDMQPTSMADVIDRAVAATAGLFTNKGLDLRVELAPDLPAVKGDHDSLMQVVINLLSNAVKFTERGSVTCRAVLAADGLEVSVSDTGMGIAPEDQARVFDKFIQVGDTLTDKPHGTGLGLPICREIVERHGGRIRVVSELSQGSTFMFVLPVAETNG